MGHVHPDYKCDKHGEIGAAVITMMAYDRETGETIDEFIGCALCYMELLRANVKVAVPVKEKGNGA